MPAIRLQFRRGTFSEWNSKNPLLASGEMGMEIGPGDPKFKIGDGSRLWIDLPYVGFTGPVGETGPTGAAGVTISTTGYGSILLKGETGYHYSDLVSVSSIGATGSVIVDAPLYAYQNVGLGTTLPSWPLHITRSVSTTSDISGYSLFWNTSPSTLTTSSSDSYGIVVESTSGLTTQSGVKAGFFFAASSTLVASDKRIKTEIRDVSDGEALETLRKIEPTRYKYIDKLSRADDEVFGFIAQQVKEHLPMAVHQTTEFIPNIFAAKPLQYRTDAFSTYCTILDISEAIIATCVSGQMIRLYDITDIKYDIPIYSVDSSNSLTIIMPSDMTCFNIGTTLENKTFIYGLQVKDFNALMKDYLYTVNFAATQELDRTVQKQAAEITQLKSIIAAMQTQMAAIMVHIGI
jgi:hypothetical protein